MISHLVLRVLVHSDWVPQQAGNVKGLVRNVGRGPGATAHGEVSGVRHVGVQVAFRT